MLGKRTRTRAIELHSGRLSAETEKKDEERIMGDILGLKAKQARDDDEDDSRGKMFNFCVVRND